MDILGANMYI